MLKFTKIWTKKRFFQNDLMKCRFLRNIDSFGYMGKNDFSKLPQNNLILLEMLIFLDIWAIFSKRSKEKHLLLEFEY